MDKIKIYEIAKKLGLASKDVLEAAQKLNIDVKSHMSGVSEEDAKKIEDTFSKNSASKSSERSIKSSSKVDEKATKNESAKSPKVEEKVAKKEEKAPFIIRREVIIKEEDSKKQENKKQNEKNNHVGIVERKNKDFNIVYRNKPNKPKTLNELFGLNKSEKKVTDVSKQPIQEAKNNETSNQNIGALNRNVDASNQTTSISQDSSIQKTESYNKQNSVNMHNAENSYSDSRRQNFANGKNSNYQENRNYQGKNYQGERNNQGRNNFNDRNGRFGNKNDRFNNDSNNFRKNNKSNFNGNNYNRRPLDERGIEKNIKDIMSMETSEKEVVRDYSKNIDKQKLNNKFDENRNKKNRNRRSENNDFDEGKLKSLRHSNMSGEDEDMLDYYDLTTQRGRRNKKKSAKTDEKRNKQKIFELKEIEIPETITVKDLAAEIKKTTAEVIKKLIGYGIMATINQELDFDTAYLVAGEFGITAKKKETVTDEDILFDDSEDKEEDLEVRPPVVVVMGHVDHGKTSLLDTIRKTNVIGGEAGGITQAIGAYKVKVNGREITFLDTPGHEAFTAMRARGAQITDIAILVVAANDGIMPQTVEAINHAKSAGIPIIVAINKIDLPDANVDKVKQELMNYELVPEEWGGDTICVPISAKNNINIDQLLEMVLLEADVLELKANPNKQAKGVVIEARLDKGKGAIATMLVQRGKLDVGDTIIVGSSIGRIRAMTNENGKKVKSAGPSTPVEIMGLTEVPEAGDTFYEVKDEKTAKHLIEKRKREAREKAFGAATKVTLDNLFEQMEEGNLKVLNLIVKADVQGSVEAVKQSMEKLQNEEVKVKVIHAAPGAVNESDVTLAKVSNAIIIAFNVRPIPAAKEMAEKEEVQIKQYSVIYQAIEEVEAAMKGMLAPKYEEKVIGNAEVRQTFRISNVGTIAGAYVLSGKVERNAGVRVIRDNVVIHEGKLATLKRFKDDAKEVTKGFECGMQIENYNDVKEGDIIEVYIMEEIKR